MSKILSKETDTVTEKCYVYAPMREVLVYYHSVHTRQSIGVHGVWNPQFLTVW